MFQTREDERYAEKEKIGRGRWSIPLAGRIRSYMARLGRKWKIRLLLVVILLFLYFTFYTTREKFQVSPIRHYTRC